MKVCFIVCFYKGARRDGQELLYNEYLRTHKQMLKQIKHNLSNVVFVISEDGRETIETTVEDNITYLYRPNKGISFGGWADVCNLYKESYDYYIFCEDDYFFVKDNFDTILVDEYNSCGKQYMVTWRDKSDIHTPKYHGEHISTVGILSSKILSDIEYFKDYRNTRITDHEQLIYEFLNSFSTIGHLSEKHERFVFYVGVTLVTDPFWSSIIEQGFGYESTYDKIIIFDNNPKESDELNKKRVLVCCFQALSDYVLLDHGLS